MQSLFTCLLAVLAMITLPVGPSGAARSVITLKMRVHLMQSDTMPSMHTSLTEVDVRRVIGKVNQIWAQAGIQFEIESIGPTKAQPLAKEMRTRSMIERVLSMIPKDRLSAKAINVCYVKELEPNGFFYQEPVMVKETAKLQSVPGGIDEPIPRVTAHEIGHELGLVHRQEATNLMQSGTNGYLLNEEEIGIARMNAQRLLLKHSS